MAIYIKGFGCDCPECGADPCAEGCICTFTASGSCVNASPAYCGDTYYYDVTGQFITAHDIAISITNNLGTLLSSVSLSIEADSVLIFDSGDVTTSLSDSVTVPAGTTELAISIEDRGEEIHDTDWSVSC